MDLLYHRYASPLPLLDTAIAMGRLNEFINILYKQIDEDMLWQLYLSQWLKEGSFEDWKTALANSMDGGNVKGQQPVVFRDEAKAAVRHAENILDNFTPPD